MSDRPKIEITDDLASLLVERRVLYRVAPDGTLSLPAAEWVEQTERLERRIASLVSALAASAGVPCAE